MDYWEGCEQEPNDLPAEANGPIQFDETHCGLHDDTKDYFFLIIPEGSTATTLTATLSTAASGSQGVQLQLRDDNSICSICGPLVYDPSGPGYQVTWSQDVAPGKKFYIYIYTGVTMPVASYNLTVTLGP